MLCLICSIRLFSDFPYRNLFAAWPGPSSEFSGPVYCLDIHSLASHSLTASHISILFVSDEPLLYLLFNHPIQTSLVHLSLLFRLTPQTSLHTLTSTCHGPRTLRFVINLARHSTKFSDSTPLILTQPDFGSSNPSSAN